MALPKIDLPISELELPSTKEKVRYRPFTVKEEKILLVAQESGDPEQELLAARQIVNNCLIDIDISTLAMFDLEYILLLLRARSVDNSVMFEIKDPDTGESVQLELNIDEVQVTRNQSHTNQIRVNEDYILYLKYPTIDEFAQIIKMDPKDPLVNYYIMVSCLDKIASEDELHMFSEYTQEETDEFMEGMPGEVIKGIQNFFETMPKLRHELKYRNNEGKDQTFVVEGTRSFFS
jgi:hypothetical protein